MFSSVFKIFKILIIYYAYVALMVAFYNDYIALAELLTSMNVICHSVVPPSYPLPLGYPIPFALVYPLRLKRSAGTDAASQRKLAT
jgi:hypothetical protein